MPDSTANPPDLKARGGRSRPRILAVVNPGEDLRLVKGGLEAGGMECHIGQDGATALSILADKPMDVVILEEMMPQMDGYEVFRRIKGSEGTRDIPVIFLTAKWEPRDRLGEFDWGAHDYVHKPIEPQELLARTQAALRVKWLQD